MTQKGTRKRWTWRGRRGTQKTYIHTHTTIRPFLCARTKYTMPSRLNGDDGKQNRFLLVSQSQRMEGLLLQMSSLNVCVFCVGGRMGGQTDRGWFFLRSFGIRSIVCDAAASHHQRRVAVVLLILLLYIPTMPTMNACLCACIVSYVCVMFRVCCFLTMAFAGFFFFHSVVIII